jgi:hypothetical protein
VQAAYAIVNHIKGKYMYAYKVLFDLRLICILAMTGVIYLSTATEQTIPSTDFPNRTPLKAIYSYNLFLICLVGVKMYIEQKIEHLENAVAGVMFKSDMLEIINDCKDKIALIQWLSSQNISCNSNLFSKSFILSFKARKYMNRAFTTDKDEFVGMIKEIYAKRDELDKLWEIEEVKIMKEMERKEIEKDIRQKIEKQLNDEKQKTVELKKKEKNELSKYIA